MVLSFYTLPTLGSAYFYGRRHATLTALAQRPARRRCMTWYNPVLFAAAVRRRRFASTRWLDITVWGGVLIITGYSMGTLYEHKTAQIDELRETYHGVLHDSSPLHREGHLHREPLVSRLGVCRHDRDEP